MHRFVVSARGGCGADVGGDDDERLGESKRIVGINFLLENGSDRTDGRRA
jgi:hypothetical protein